MDGSKTKKNVIKRLDFENCEITTVKFRRKVWKGLKAKISECNEDLAESCGLSQNNPFPAPVNVNESSPILLRKGSAKKRINETPSPVLITKKTCKKRICTEKATNLESHDECSPSTSSCAATNLPSPVLLFKRVRRKQIKELEEDSQSKDLIFTCDTQESSDQSQHELIQSFPSPKPSGEILIVDDDKDSLSDCDYNIEEFTPDKSSKEIGISSFSSESRVVSDIICEHQPRENNDLPSFKTPEKFEPEEDASILDSGRKRIRHKKGGFVALLINFRQRQASERRIREHMKKYKKMEENWKMTLQVIDLWKEGMRLFLKCQKLKMAEEITKVVEEPVFVILNKDLGNDIWKIGEGTLFRIARPWQELRTVNMKILLNVASIELIDDAPQLLVPKIKMCEIPISRYKEDEDSIFSDLFDIEDNVFLGDIQT